MESPAENKRTAALALAVLGLLMVGALLVLVVFDGDGDTPDQGSANPTAAGGATNGGSGGGSADGKPSDGTSGGAGSVKPIISQDEAAQAHKVMTDYMAGLSTYAHTDDPASWAAPLLALTNGDANLKQETTLPTGKAWDMCVAAKCSSRGTATVSRDAMVAVDLVRGGGRTVSSLVKVTAARSEDGRSTDTETNSWLVTVRDSGAGRWKVSSFSIFGLGNVGASDQAGG